MLVADAVNALNILGYTIAILLFVFIVIPSVSYFLYRCYVNYLLFALKYIMNKNHVGQFCKKRVVDETPERERIIAENKKRRLNVVDINGTFFNEIPAVDDICDGCYFEQKSFCTDLPPCSAKWRKDNQSVIYKLWELKQ